MKPVKKKWMKIQWIDNVCEKSTWNSLKRYNFVENLQLKLKSNERSIGGRVPRTIGKV